MALRTLDQSMFVAAMIAAILAGGGCSSTEADKPGTDGPVTTSDAGADGSSVHACSAFLPLPRTPCFSCDPLPAGAPDGCGAPLPKVFGWDGSGIPEGVSYPVGCTVYLPVENPYYPGGPQSCDCSDFVNPTSPSWICPL